MSPQLLLYVEGETEEEFARKILFPHFAAEGLICHGPILAANSVRGGRVARGGLRAYAPVKKDVENLLKQYHNPNFRFTTMLDLYGLPADFPGKSQLSASDTGANKAAAVADAWKKDIPDRRFIPFVFSYEFEALVLANPDSLRVACPGADKGVADLKADIAGLDPEEINDSTQTAPSKRIIRHIDGYDKILAGLSAIKETGLDEIRRRCPHFDGWLSELENLSGA